MKKLHFLFMALILSALCSCDNDKTTHFDKLGIYPLSSGAVITYADQTSDSIIVVSSKKWTLTANSDWMGIGSSSQKTLSDVATNKMPLEIKIQKNTTGTVRSTSLTLSNGDYKVGRLYYQTYWLNVTYPQVAFSIASLPVEHNFDRYNGAHFDLNVKKNDTKDHISFNIFAAQAKLTTDATWVSPKEVNVERGSHQVDLTFSPNTTDADRKAVYKLTTSNGITTEITVTQKGK